MVVSPVRTRFERDLNRLFESVLELGSLARQAMTRAMQTLEQGNAELAREVVADDARLNELRYNIEKQCYALIATEQPVAGDLRAIIAALTISTDLERIGDHGKKLARIYLRMTDQPLAAPLTNISRLAELSLGSLERVMKAYAAHDVAEAKAVCQADDQIDAYYKQTFNVLLSYMLENPRVIAACTQLLQAAHELERVGDRATNIGERVIYSVTGELSDLNA